MLKIISFDVDGTLVDTAYADKVWLEGVPSLYAQEHDMDFDTAREEVRKAYETIGDGDVRWYELPYWFNRFGLKGSHEDVLDRYVDTIHVYDEVVPVLQRLHESHVLIVASNAHRDFLIRTLQSVDCFIDQVFSATSDYREVGKSQDFFMRICQVLEISPREMAHVGDHFQFDYVFPSQVGIHAFFLDREGKKSMTQQGLQSLQEFEEKIRELEGSI